MNTGYFVAQGISGLYKILVKCVRKITRRILSKSNHSRHQQNNNVVTEARLPSCSYGQEVNNDAFVTEREDQMVTLSRDKEQCSSKGEANSKNGNANRRDKHLLTDTRHPKIQKAGTIDESMDTDSSTEDGDHVDDGHINIPLWFMLLVLVCVSLFAASIIFKAEMAQWTFLDSLYFVTVTFTTVGFGDLTFDLSRMFQSDLDILWLVIYTSVLMQVGLLLTAGFITVWSERVERNVKTAKRKLESKLSTIRVSET